MKKYNVKRRFNLRMNTKDSDIKTYISEDGKTQIDIFDDGTAREWEVKG